MLAHRRHSRSLAPGEVWRRTRTAWRRPLRVQSLAANTIQKDAVADTAPPAVHKAHGSAHLVKGRYTFRVSDEQCTYPARLRCRDAGTHSRSTQIVVAPPAPCHDIQVKNQQVARRSAAVLHTSSVSRQPARARVLERKAMWPASRRAPRLAEQCGVTGFPHRAVGAGRCTAPR
jgi:hypothetical protein